MNCSPICKYFVFYIYFNVRQCIYVIYLHACVYEYMHVFLCARRLSFQMYLWMYVSIYLCINILNNICKYIHMWLWVCVWISVCTRKHRHIRPHLHTHNVCVSVCVWVYICIKTHTHPHTYIRTYKYTLTCTLKNFKISRGNNFFLNHFLFYFNSKIIDSTCLQASIKYFKKNPYVRFFRHIYTLNYLRLTDMKFIYSDLSHTYSHTFRYSCKNILLMSISITSQIQSFFDFHFDSKFRKYLYFHTKYTDR